MIVIIGDDPYHARSKSREEKNGEWRVEAEDVESALERMFSSMMFPGAATGRYQNLFIPGISLPYHANEVIQVWTHDIAAVNRMRAVCRTKPDCYCPHSGNGQHVGVIREVHVSELKKYVAPERKLLAPVAGESNALSPLGASLISLHQKRQQIQRSMMMNQYEVAVKRRDMEKLEEQLEAQQEKLKTGMGLLNMYLHGSSQVIRICHGSPAPTLERWRVFQSRQYLNKEIALLGDFRDFDFKNMEELDEWLRDTGRIWKFLPFPKTILVTRIRDNAKDYGDPFDNLYLNQLNYQNIIWIRNGENVVRVNVEHHFENAVFPDPLKEQKLMASIEERVWKSYFSSVRRDWRGEPIKEKEHYGLKKNAEKEAEPYGVKQVTQNRFKTMEAWKASEEYRMMERQMREQVFDYIREKNKEQMSFLMLLQGIVDHTKLLDVPPGTDLFQAELCSRYFELIYDYSHGLPDHTYSNQMAQHMTNLKKGDWIIVPHVYVPSKGTKNRQPTLYQICRFKDGKPVIQWYPRSERRRWNKEEYGYEFPRVKNPRSLVLELERVPFIRTDVPLKLAELILDDRDWKMKHQWLVPLLARWREVQKKYLAAPVNGAEITLEKKKRNE